MSIEAIILVWAVCFILNGLLIKATFLAINEQFPLLGTPEEQYAEDGMSWGLLLVSSASGPIGVLVSLFFYLNERGHARRYKLRNKR